ncbi:MAG: ATP-binding protein [Ruminococcus sp.]|nr:ATP-binding protein [Ruminococcus sp.]
MHNLRKNQPAADVLMVSMRAMGYSFESAVADILDNSISAHATEIKLKFPVEPTECYVAICDNGDGMTKDELFDAMKYGSEYKRNGRADDDLGRFGLGMKSASLSQCRRLTVASRKNGIISAYVWDLDIIEENHDWYMIECSEEQIAKIRFIDYLDKHESGTIVVWENFDVIQKSFGNVYSELSKRMTSIENYISLIFHRFLNRNDKSAVKIWLNNCRLNGLDPFLENHNKTDIRREISITVPDSSGKEHIIKVQPFILPFQKDLSYEDKKLSGGAENYRSMQGFYIYRSGRLIVWGTWFNRHRDELTKYARIRVDIPNSLDDIWGIDIKKQSATVPLSIRKRLTKAIDETMDKSVQKQRYRGRTDNIDEETDYIWNRKSLREGLYTYQINRNSRIFDILKEKINDEALPYLDMVLEEIEKNVPYQQIYIDKSQNVINEEVTDERIADVEGKAEIIIKMSMQTGATDINSVIDRLFNSEPFCNYPELKQKLKGHT